MKQHICYVVAYFYFILFSDERLHFQALFCKIFLNLFYLSFMFHVFILVSFILFLICIYLIFYFLYLFYIFYLFISLYCIVLLLIILFLDKRLPFQAVSLLSCLLFCITPYCSDIVCGYSCRLPLEDPWSMVWLLTPDLGIFIISLITLILCNCLLKKREEGSIPHMSTLLQEVS